MKDMSTAADKIRKASEDMVTQEQRIADNARIATAVSSKQARESLATTIAQNQLDQRAWVSVKQLKFDPIAIGKHITAIAVVTNVGKTNAQDAAVSVHISGRPQLTSEPPVLTNETYTSQDKSIVTIFPQQELVADITLTKRDGAPVEVTQPIVDAFNSGQAYMYVFGEITYKDIFGKPHMTMFCYYISKPDQANNPIGCEKHNEAD